MLVYLLFPWRPCLPSRNCGPPCQVHRMALVQPAPLLLNTFLFNSIFYCVRCYRWWAQDPDAKPAHSPNCSLCCRLCWTSALPCPHVNFGTLFSQGRMKNTSSFDITGVPDDWRPRFCSSWWAPSSFIHQNMYVRPLSSRWHHSDRIPTSWPYSEETHGQGTWTWAPSFSLG